MGNGAQDGNWQHRTHYHIDVHHHIHLDPKIADALAKIAAALTAYLGFPTR